MRTTIRLDDELFREVKSLAARSGRTLTALVEDALREVVLRARRPRPSTSVELPVSKHSGGLAPGVNLDDGRALREFLDEEVMKEKGLDGLR